MCLNAFWLCSEKDNKEKLDKALENYVSHWSSRYKDIEEEDDPLCGCNSFSEFLNNRLFIEADQFVLPSLNLKTAKEIVCRNERQKKKLRKLGFFEDRIKIRNVRVL